MIDVSQLQKLFEESAPTPDDPDVPSRKHGGPRTPADFAPVSAPVSVRQSNPASVEKPKDSKSIWEDEEATTVDESLPDPHDPRKRPEFDIRFMQDVRAEDMYLGSSEKDPSSTSCDRVVVHIKLPGANITQVDLSVTKQRITVQSPDYLLSTYLPHPVKDKDGSAKWDPKTETLTVTLPIIRRDPFL